MSHSNEQPTWSSIALRQAKAKRTHSVVLFLLLLPAAAPSAWAWGREGHRLTALVAEQYLTPETKAQVAELLATDKPGETMADIASWADDYRTGHPETERWHFADIPSTAETLDRQRDCPEPKANPTSPWRDCVTDRILYFEGRLGDTSLSLADRAFALKFLVHLIGDVHQPFHTLGDARGGNAIAVNFLGSTQCDNSKCNLHGVWDYEIIGEQGLSEQKYLDRLLDEIKANDWQRMDGGAPTAWANISHHYAVLAMVPNNALLTHEYVDAEAKVIDAQLALGGLRLAHVLNRILGADDAAPAAAH